MDTSTCDVRLNPRQHPRPAERISTQGEEIVKGADCGDAQHFAEQGSHLSLRRIPWRHVGRLQLPRQLRFEAGTLDLARGTGGNRVDDDESAGNLEFGQATEQGRANLVGGCGRAILQHHGGRDIFAQRRVVHAECRR